MTIISSNFNLLNYIEIHSYFISREPLMLELRLNILQYFEDFSLNYLKMLVLGVPLNFHSHKPTGRINTLKHEVAASLAGKKEI